MFRIYHYYTDYNLSRTRYLYNVTICHTPNAKPEYNNTHHKQSSLTCISNVHILALYFLSGAGLIKTKGLSGSFLASRHKYCVIYFCFRLFIREMGSAIQAVIDLIPDWFGFGKGLVYVLWPLAVITALLVFALILGH